jgi:hypothetical protein
MTPTTPVGPATATGTCEPDVGIDDTQAVRAAGRRDHLLGIGGRRLRQHDKQFESGGGAAGHITRASDVDPSAAEHVDHPASESGSDNGRRASRPGHAVHRRIGRRLGWDPAGQRR